MKWKYDRTKWLSWQPVSRGWLFSPRFTCQTEKKRSRKTHILNTRWDSGIHNSLCRLYVQRMSVFICICPSRVKDSNYGLLEISTYCCLALHSKSVHFVSIKVSIKTHIIKLIRLLNYIQNKKRLSLCGMQQKARLMLERNPEKQLN